VPLYGTGCPDPRRPQEEFIWAAPGAIRGHAPMNDHGRYDADTEALHALRQEHTVLEVYQGSS